MLMENLTNQMCEVLNAVWSVLNCLYLLYTRSFSLTPFHVAMVSSTWVPQCSVTKMFYCIINSKVWLSDEQVKKPHRGKASKVHLLCALCTSPPSLFFFCSTTDIHDSPYFSAWLQAVIATVAQFLPWIDVCIAVLDQNSLCFSD